MSNRFDEINEKLVAVREEIESWENEDREKVQEYRDLLDEVNETVQIHGCTGSTGNLSFQPSDIMENCDPVAFRCGYCDFSSDRISELEETEEDLIEERLELINEKIKVFIHPDNVGDFITVIYEDGSYIGMNHIPTHPQGIGMHGEGLDFDGENSHLGEEKKFTDLNTECQGVVLRDLCENQ